MQMLSVVLEAGALALTLSLDAFAASFAYGSKGIGIPLRSAAVIDGVCGMVLGASMALGALLSGWIPPWAGKVVCCVILLLLGLFKLVEDLMKALIRRCGVLEHAIRFSLCDLRFVLSVYADPEAADIDRSNSISTAEALSLSLALSLDGAAAGMGAVMGRSSAGALLVAFLAANMLALWAGARLGVRSAAKRGAKMSWLSGAILIALALWKML